MKLQRTLTTKLEKDVYEEVKKRADRAAVKVGTMARILLNSIIKKAKKIKKGEY